MPLEPKTYDLLLFLIQHRDRVVSKGELMLWLWPDATVEEANLNRHIYTLRTKLGDDSRNPHYIKNIPRVGYRFIAPVKESHSERTATSAQEPEQLTTAVQPPALADTSASAQEQVSDVSAQVEHVRRRQRVRIGLGIVAVLLIAAGSWWLEQWLREKPLPPEPPLPLLTYEFEVVTLDAQGNEKERRKGSAKYFVEKLPDGTPLEMVAIPAGELLMGTSEAEAPQVEYEYMRYLPPQKRAEVREWVPHEMPQHRVKVPAFYLGKYEVTQEQWRAVAKLPKVNRDLHPQPSMFEGDKLPVTHVSWDEVREFCERLLRDARRPYRLPSEAEWEYACRAGTTTAFHFGETITAQYANFNGKYPYGQAPPGEYRGRTTPVGYFKVANAFGLYDMHGNVWEWCLDAMLWTYSGVPSDGSAHKGDDRSILSRVLRGGAYGNDNPPDPEQWTFYNYCAFDCRSAKRNAQPVASRNRDVGFRLAMSAAR